MDYVLLTVFESRGFHQAIVGISEKYHYISEAGNAAYREWRKQHDRTPGKDTYYDYKFLGGGVEFINCVEG